MSVFSDHEFAAWCGGLSLAALGGVIAFAYSWRSAALYRPVPGQVMQVRPNSNTSGKVRSLIADVRVPDAVGADSTVLIFPDSALGGVWAGRDLTLWRRPGSTKPPRMHRPGWPGRSLAVTGAALIGLAALFYARSVNSALHLTSHQQMKLFGVLFTIFAVGLAVVSLNGLGRTRRILRGPTADGRIIGLVRKERSTDDGRSVVTYTPIVAFTTADGLRVSGLTVTSSTRRRKWAGRKVKVRYVPGRPERFRMAKPSEAWSDLSTFVFSLPLIAVGVAGVVIGLRP